MSFSTKMQESIAQIDELKKELAGATKALESNTEDSAALELVESITTQIDAKTKQLSAMEKANEAMKDRVKYSAPAVVKSVKDVDRGELFMLAAAAKVKAHVEQRSVREVIAEDFKDDVQKAAVASINKTAVDVGHTGTGFGAELAAEATAGFYDLVVPRSAAMQLADMGTRLNFNGYRAINVPYRGAQTGPLNEPAFVGQGGVIPLMGVTFKSKKLEPHKLAAITGWTNELENATSGEIAQIMRQIMVDTYAQRLDEAVFSDAAAVAGVRDAGLRHGLAGGATGTGSTATGPDAVLADLKTLVNFLQTNYTLGRPVIVMNSASKLGLGMMQTTLGEMAFRQEVISNSTLLGVPIVDSPWIPAGVALIVDASSFVAAFGAIEFATSTEATLTLANADHTAPTQAQDGAGDLGTAGEVKVDDGIFASGNSVVHTASGGAASAGYVARSLFQTYCTALRLVSPCSYGMTRDNALAELKSIKW